MTAMQLLLSWGFARRALAFAADLAAVAPGSRTRSPDSGN
jgi:hypothetical protein